MSRSVERRLTVQLDKEPKAVLVKRIADLEQQLFALNNGRLAGLAEFGARHHHDWWFDPTENMDDLPPAGHVQPFDTCPHPDCALVRNRHD